MVVHDILLGLLGFTGDIVEVVSSPANDDPQLKLSRIVKLETFDRDIVEGVLELGSMYLTLRLFVDSRKSASLYDRAIGLAIEAKILPEYESDIVDVERKMLSLMTEENLSVSLSSIRLDLWEKYYQGFQLLTKEVIIAPHIDSVIELQDTFRHSYIDIVVEGVVGCFIKELEAWCRYAVIPGGRTSSKFLVRESDSYSYTGNRIDEIALYQIDRRLIPEKLVSFETCDKILFCGRGVLVLQDGNRSTLVVSHEETFFKDRPLLGYHKAREYIAEEVEKLRSLISKKLYEKLSQGTNPNLKWCLEALRGLYLMGYSNQWVSFMEESVMGSRRLGHIFHTVFENIPVTIAQMNEDCEIDFNLPWPMELILSSSALDQYKKIMKSLYRVSAAGVRARYCYNMQITCLFASLQSYLQMDVIQSAFRVLMGAVVESSDIQKIAHAHEEFLSNIHLGCLVGLPSVWDHLDRIFQLSDELAVDRFLQDVIDNQVKAEMQLLVKTLEDLRERPSHRIVEKLLLKLNFNHFYTEDNSTI